MVKITEGCDRNRPDPRKALKTRRQAGSGSGLVPAGTEDGSAGLRADGGGLGGWWGILFLGGD